MTIKIEGKDTFYLPEFKTLTLDGEDITNQLTSFQFDHLELPLELNKPFRAVCFILKPQVLADQPRKGSILVGDLTLS